MQRLVAIRRRLQELADFRGLGNELQSYELLSDPDRPAWWDSRAGRNGGLTLDQLEQSRSVIYGFPDNRSHHGWLRAGTGIFPGITYSMIHPLPNRRLPPLAVVEHLINQNVSEDIII